MNIVVLVVCLLVVGLMGLLSVRINPSPYDDD
jgi:hypothetical protein